MPNYSYFFGDLCSGALSNLYYPHPVGEQVWFSPMLRLGWQGAPQSAISSWWIGFPCGSTSQVDSCSVLPLIVRKLL